MSVKIVDNRNVEMYILTIYKCTQWNVKTNDFGTGDYGKHSI